MLLPLVLPTAVISTAAAVLKMVVLLVVVVVQVVQVVLVVLVMLVVVVVEWVVLGGEVHIPMNIIPWFP